MFRFVPPVGHPIKIFDIIVSFVKSITEQNSEFEVKLNNILSIKKSFTISSGTSALYVILRSIKKITGKNEVIIPAYTCPSLIASAKRAGMKAIICDTNPNDFDFNLECLKKIISKNTAAIIAVHLFGIPSDIKSINKIGQENEILVVEDSTQLFGAKIGELIPGLTADIGFFSFGRGKPVSMLAGGAIVTKSKQFEKIVNEEISNLPEITRINLILSVIKLFIYKFLVLPQLFWIPNSLPFLKIGETEYRDDFVNTKLSKFHKILFSVLIDKFDEYNLDRVKKSLYLFNRLKNIKSDKITFIKPDLSDVPFLRFPILLSNKQLRNKVLLKLRSSGIGATDMYKKPLNKIKGIPKDNISDETFINSESISERLITLPVNSFTKYDDLDNVIKIIKENVNENY